MEQTGEITPEALEESEVVKESDGAKVPGESDGAKLEEAELAEAVESEVVEWTEEPEAQPETRMKVSKQ